MADSPATSAVNRETVAVIIPAYLEEKHVRAVVERTRRVIDHVLVVDDGSTDRTASEALAGGAEVLTHDRNQGKGAAIMSGLRHWLERGFPHAIILDADGQHLPEEISRFLSASASGCELLVGTRMNDVRQMPLVRRAVNRYMSRKISRVCGQEIPDTQCGFRMLSAALIPHLLDGECRFDYETEMLIIASRKGFKIGAVPISTVYSDEVSSIHPVHDTIRFFKLMRRYRTR